MVYLLHFDQKFGHARHYTGFAETPASLARRLEHHQKGTGAKLLARAAAQGVTWKVARVWNDGDRNFERTLKNRHGASRYCPLCKK